MVVVVVTVAAVGFAFHFNGHFSRWTWVNRFYWRKVWWKWWWQLELWGANLQSNCHHQQTFKCWTHHPTSPWPSLVAGPGTDSIPSLHSGIPMSQWISAAISRWERSSDSRCGRSSPPPLFYHHDACCPVSAAINSWRPRLSCHCITGMEQPTTCHPNCFILHLLSATTEDTSV